MAATIPSPVTRIARWLTRRTVMPWLLAAAYLPALTFFGHWPLAVDIPGTSLYVGLPTSAPKQGHSHEDHCHADAGSCSDAPVTSTATVAILADSLRLTERDPPMISLVPGGTDWRAQVAIAPIARPPENAVLG